MSMLTDAELKTAAMLYCKAFGLDPEEKVQHGHPSGLAVALYSPRWMLVAAEIKDHDAKAEAIEGARHGQT